MSSVFRLFSALVLAGMAMKPAEAVRGGENALSVAFVVYDAGETLGLLPVAPILSQAGVRVDWFPLTPWSARILTKEGVDFPALPKEVVDMPHTTDRLSVGEIDDWMDRLLATKPELVVTGLVSGIQGALAEKVSRAGIATRGFCDSFERPKGDSIFIRIGKTVDEVWVATEAVREGMAGFLERPVRTLGQPSVEAWSRLQGEVDVDGVLSRQGVEKGNRLVVFAGQYGDNYGEVLTAFAEGAAAFVANNEDVVFVFSHHPRTSGAIEDLVLKRIGSSQLVMADEGLTTAELAAASSVFATWQSTAGFQATFMGKPVVFFGLTPEGYTNVLIERRLARYATLQNLGDQLRGAAGECCDVKRVRRDLMAAGFVTGADRKIAEEILSILSELVGWRGR